MYQRLREFCTRVSIFARLASETVSYDHPEASVSLVGLLVEVLVCRHVVLSVDQTMISSVRSDRAIEA